MAKRTSMNLDMELVNAARAVLGTGSATQTVHEALRQVVRRRELEPATEVLLSLDDEQVAAIEGTLAGEDPWDDVLPASGEPGYEKAMRAYEEWVEQGQGP